MLTRLTVRAFKGLREFDISPKRMNLLIGANGTGKTNFTDLIAFIAGLGPRRLTTSIDALGGLAQVRTRQSGSGKPAVLHIALHLGEDSFRGIKEARFEFALAPTKTVKVQRESLDAVVYKRVAGRPALQGIPRFDTAQPIRLCYVREGLQITEWSTESLGQRGSDFDDEQELILAPIFSFPRCRMAQFVCWDCWLCCASLSPRAGRHRGAGKCPARLCHPSTDPNVFGAGRRGGGMIVILVEGDGDKRAVPILVGRKSLDLKVRAIDMRGKSNIVRAHHGMASRIRCVGSTPWAAVPSWC